jgi:preprotein translocase subunit SecY
VASQVLISLTAFVAPLLACSNATLARSASSAVTRLLREQSPLIGPLLFLLVFGYTFLYAEKAFQEADPAGQLQRSGAFIPGLRPGAETRSYLARVQRRVTLLPAVVIGLLVVLPWLAERLAGLPLSLLEGEDLFILTATVIAVWRSLEAEVLLHSYKGFLRR